MCPEGIPYSEIKEVSTYEQPGKYIVRKTDYNDSFTTPVLTAGQSFILGYTDETDNIYQASKENPVIIFDDFTAAFKWVDFPFKVKSSAMKIIKTVPERALLRYLFHYMGNLNFSSNEHTRLWISQYSNFKIPLPPLPIQAEIVRILDAFTELTVRLTAELTAELTARKKQYEYYRDYLLDFSKLGGVIQRIKLGDICTISAGGDVPKEAFSKEQTSEYHIPIISNGIGQNAFYGYTDTARIYQPAVTVAARGTIGYAEYRDYPFFPIIRLLSLIPKNQELLNAKYLYYCLQGRHYNTPTSGIPQLTVPTLSDEEIPLPPLPVQQRIVDVLDNFDAVCNSLQIGLPAEIDARKKQYEYYRDRLLAFPVK